MKPGILFCSCGRRGRLLQNAQQSIGDKCSILATDNDATAPALALATKEYIVLRIDAPDYVDTIIKICTENNVKAVTTLIDPEIEVLSRNRERFLEAGILPLFPLMILRLVAASTSMRCSNTASPMVSLRL